MTFSPFLAQSSREMYVYTRGYTDGYDYVVDTIGEMEEWEEKAALATDADALRGDPAQASPAPGARFAAPGSSAGLTSSPSDDGARVGSGVKTVAHDDDLGHVVASYERPGPGWVAVGTLSDSEFDALDDDAYTRNVALERARQTVADQSDGDRYAPMTLTFKMSEPPKEWNTTVYDARYEVDSDGTTYDLDDCPADCKACAEDENDANYRLTPKGEALADELIAKYKAEGALMAALDDVPGRKKATLVGNVIGLATAATIVAKNKDRGDIIEALELAGLEATQNLLDAYK